MLGATELVPLETKDPLVVVVVVDDVDEDTCTSIEELRCKDTEAVRSAESLLLC